MLYGSKSIRRWLALFLVGIGLSGIIAACGPQGDSGDSASQPDVEITLASFAVTKAAHDAIIPKFQEKWKAEHNQNVRFNQSYGGSGSQTRAILDGLEADIVHLAVGVDVDRLAEGGLVSGDWTEKLPDKGIVTKSVATIITRDGNPKNLTNWPDLARDGVSFITADPKTSGVAQWNFLALWGSVTQTGGTEEQAKEFVTQAFRNAPILSKDAREATDTFFTQGQGDALVNYENEAILANLKGENLPYTVPSVNISIDNPLAVVDANVDKHGNREVVEAFAEFLYTPEAQREFAAVGFRPVEPTVIAEYADKFPKIETLFTIDDLGGWGYAREHFFGDGGVFDQIIAAGRS
ncbi:sulfate ABC transporter substrate-binding protein [Candidatus Synechococcus calcipolaris G9]|uniref:Sulfate ABC transporter substrate-binding protein n=1 Tax=Candidatus Synechococcus calcipolaris G9 TaxID=1497997 RepID=A0ABT6F3F2_9SYNE|nr:sulfate ABC transporter substrate-binding protein [Candidatus Synechococcus calcipolaris]MDG2992354.1 sulfate ABC transporter substrate-binding protein [Candidatus Synechococcus calcipolaris G9]